jgi:hypothetical protein
MLMSIASAPVLATWAAARRIVGGSSPNSWMPTGPPRRSRGSIRSISVHVLAFPCRIAWEETISETAMPAP